jgi:glycosyltransferase involved in cell wall biosynthesis
LKQQVMESLGLPGEKIHVIPHVLCGNEGNGGVFGGPEQDPCVLFFGRIWEYKGLDYLIRAEPLIAAQVPDVKFIIAGTGEDFARYRRLMEHPERFVVHNEYVSDEMRARLFRQASLVALPYVEASQSGVIPVAYSFGKPVVATSVGGLPALVDDGRTGFLIPPRDEQALATAIVRLLQDKDLRLRMGACAKQKLHAECAPARVAAQTFAVYRRAVDLDTPERGA